MLNARHAGRLHAQHAITSTELAKLRKSFHHYSNMTGCLVSLALVSVPFTFIGFYLTATWGGRHAWGIVGALLAITILVTVARARRGAFASLRKRMERDLEEETVEVLVLRAVNVYEIPATHSSVDPAFAIELEDKRMLLLLGEWLGDPTTFGGDWSEMPSSEASDDEASLTDYRFPVSAFTLHRFPHSGYAARIELEGPYVAPERLPVDVDVAGINDFPTRIVEGTLQDLPAVVKRLGQR